MWRVRGRRQRGTGGTMSPGNAPMRMGMTTMSSARMDSSARHRWAPSGPTPGGCMTFWAMSGSGLRIARTVTIRVPRPMGVLGGREIVPGRVLRGGSWGLRPSEPPFGVPQLVLGRVPIRRRLRIPRRPDHKLTPGSLPRHLLNGGPGGGAPWSRHATEFIHS